MAAYGATLGGGFVFDDHALVEKNAFIRGLDFIPYLFSRPYWASDVRGPRAAGGLYRPLVTTSYALNRAALGPGPLGYRVVNLALHAAVCLLLLLLLEGLGLPPPAAAFAAAAFAVLPVHVEAVAWIVGRSELLGAIFVLLSWLALRGRPSRARLSAGWAAFAAALLCKENTATFPFALAACEAALSNKPWRKTAEERKVVWAGLAGVLALYFEGRKLLLGAALGGASDVDYFAGRGPLVALLTMSRFILEHYLWPLATGLGLRLEYTRPSYPDASVSDPASWLALAALAALAALCLRAALRRRPWGAAGLAVLLLLLPSSNLVVRNSIIGAERFLYLPSAAFCALLGLGAAALRPSKAKTAGLAALLCVWTALSARRGLAWSSDDALFAAEALRAPDSPHVLDGLGTAAARRGDFEGARALYLKALALDPTFLDSRYNLAKSYFDGGRPADAERAFRALDAERPDKDVLCFLGVLAEKRGDRKAARELYAKALELNPYETLALRNLGLLLAREKRLKEALPYLRAYVRLSGGEPEAEDVRMFLGMVGEDAAGHHPPPRRR